MPISELIDRATKVMGNQTRLAETIGMKQSDLSKVKRGERTISLERRIALAEIADYDPKVAAIEDIIERLDTSDPMQVELATQLQAVINAFPNEGWRKRCPPK